ncbi:unnamed protein product [Rotaria magnacalcarata]|uniref:Uncharacterized protein n=1 Tax=Rotaria magnacalcarata TaxID=392030 RepID=A0A8S2N7F2_9BILA|nr:unnamed protein product [Rotaria magnacalcarata]CAF4464949.1 unnamed protein product [Rotaria magnacalcarata]CAF4652691.1 unnamed protein product [Rotaria magnacalcarata]
MLVSEFTLSEHLSIVKTIPFIIASLIWVALAVAVEKAATIFLDRELRKIIKRLIGCLKTRVKPLDYHTAIGTAAQGTR